MNELDKIREFRENKETDVDVSESMVRQTDEINKEESMRDIEREITKQSIDADVNKDSSNELSSTDDIQAQINYLKNHLADMFESEPVQQPEPIVQGSLPREPAIQSVGEYQETTIEAKTPVIRQTDNNIKEELLRDEDLNLAHSSTPIESPVNTRDDVIFEIIQMMYPGGVEYVPVNQIKRQLESYTDEQLEELKSQYTMQTQEQQGDRHR